MTKKEKEKKNSEAVRVRSPEASNECKAVKSIEVSGSNPISRTN
jgi:hypothetical protein